MSGHDRRFTLPSLQEASCRPNKPVSIAVLGSSTVGKDTLVSGIMKYWMDLDKILKADARKKMKGRNLDVEIMDITSEEFLQKETPTADVYVLVYSLLSASSLAHAIALRNDITNQKAKDARFVMVANKADIADDRRQGSSSKRADDHLVVSAELAEGIEEVVKKIVKNFLKKLSAERWQERQPTWFRTLRKVFRKHTCCSVENMTTPVSNYPKPSKSDRCTVS